MTTTPAEIGWSSYQNYEGPFFIGKIPYTAPANPDFLEKCMSVVTATEGGHYDAINMYDSCILSVGIIQLCCRVGELTNMLGGCAAFDLGTMRTAFSQLPIPADLKQDSSGVWRFSFLDGRGFVINEQQMKTLLLCGASGLKGQWNPAQKAQARQVAATMASIWTSAGLQMGQREYIKPRLMSFVMPRAKTTLFTNPDQTGYVGALKAAYISYAVNMPAIADKYLTVATSDPNWASASDEDKFGMAMSRIVFDPKITIWPARYNAIHPVLQSLFHVSLPTLKQLPSESEPDDPSDENLTTTKGIQKFLLDRGYDLGPKGADGFWGPATEGAVKQFQSDHHLPVSGIVDSQTKDTMSALITSGPSV